MTKDEAIKELVDKLSGLETKVDLLKYADSKMQEAIFELSGDKDSIIAKCELVEMICNALERTIKGAGCWDVLFSIKYNGPFDDSEEADNRRQAAYEKQQAVRQEFRDGVAKIEAEYVDKDDSGVH